MSIAGRAMLARVVERTARARRVHSVVVATSICPRDDPIAEIAALRGWTCFRGDEADVLDRYWRAAQEHEADVVVRVTADCPLIDPALIDQVVEILEEDPRADYASNTLAPRTFPRGLDTEAFRISALERAWRESRERSYREHVTTYIWQQPAEFELRGLWYSSDLSAERWTVDSQEDLALARAIFQAGPDHNWDWLEVLAFLDDNPDLRQLNAAIEQKSL